MLTFTLFHVSRQEFLPGQILELRLPTPHLQKYSRGLARTTKLSAEAHHKLVKLREVLCSQCPHLACCAVQKPCWLVAELLHGTVELQTRAHAFVEHLFEWEREKHFSELPSRFNCFFCWESLEDAWWFWREYRGGEGFVYRVKPAVEGVRLHRGDMKWLDCLVLSVRELQERASAYWREKYVRTRVAEDGRCWSLATWWSSRRCRCADITGLQRPEVLLKMGLAERG